MRVKPKARKREPQRGLRKRGGELAGECMHKRERGFRKGWQTLGTLHFAKV